MKAIVCFLILSCTSGLATAQDDGPSLIFRAGPTWNGLRGNSYLQENHQNIFGYYAGIDGKLPLGKHTNLVSGLAYQLNGSQTKRMQVTDDFGNIIGTGKIKSLLNYLTLPLMIEFAGGTDFKVNFQAGAFASYLLDSKTKYKMKEGGTPSGSNDLARYKDWNGGIASGLGLEVPTQNGFFFSIQFRNQVGLFNISDAPVVDDGSIKTNSTGVLIGIGKRF